MWLINCRTLTLEEHLDFKSTNYAILSHTWDSGQEVQFDEFRSKTAGHEIGWQKIKQTCRLAIDDGFDLAWVDTCCIDKKSSAELSEAINSMFSWYEWSGICYVHLTDYDPSQPDCDLSRSRWFSRGWTLQELIAPAHVKFFDKWWKLIGDKETMSKELSLITGIDERVVDANNRVQLKYELELVPGARKMSWASERQTTRDEDKAYSLFGIFGINLPLLYGEGNRAFMRLQEEIIKHSNDLSLLAWAELENDRGLFGDQWSVLARHPRCFRRSRSLALIKDSKEMPEFSITNKGLRLETEVYPLSGDLYAGEYALDINCVDPMGSGQPLSIHLRHQGHNVFARTRTTAFAEVNRSSIKISRTIFLNIGNGVDFPIAPSHLTYLKSFSVPIFKHEPMHWYLSEVCPENIWQSENESFDVYGFPNFIGRHVYRLSETSTDNYYKFQWPFQVIFGFGYGFAPWTRVMTLEQDHSISRGFIQGDWERVAQLANIEASRPVCVGFVDEASVLPHYMRDWTVAIMLRVTVERSWPLWEEEALHVSFQTELWKYSRPTENVTTML